MKQTDKKVAIVTGGSSGIGFATCQELSENGFTVYELSRRQAQTEGAAIHICCDITDENAVICAIEEIISQQNKIDLLVNNAGFGISGAVEYTPLADAKKQFDVNFFGTFNVIKAVIPHMRSYCKGKIINISSVAAEISIPYQAFYSAVKAAVNSLTLALRNELAQFGISVCAVLPGDIKTGFTAAREKTACGDDVYKGRIQKAVSAMEKDEQNGMKPQVIAAKVRRLAKKTRVKPFYTCGAKYKFFLLLNKILPKGFTNNIVGKMY